MIRPCPLWSGKKPAIKKPLSEQAKAFLGWLTVALAPTILGSKPATILSLANSKNSNLLTLWREYGSEIFADTLVKVLIMRQSSCCEILLFYRADTLKQCLCDKDINYFMKNLGYPVEEGVESCLSTLCGRYCSYCPHEIGIILGIPLKDVLGFMALTDLPSTYKGAWIVYGNRKESQALMQKFAAERSWISSLIAKGLSPYEIMCGNIVESYCV
ncbi:MAG: hypothetical protein H6Q73_1864 [Firmicutes bacterium]|nr:hypothetical protein [Bacillota bacterium]